MAFSFNFLQRVETTRGNLDRTLNERSSDVLGSGIDLWTYNAGVSGSNEPSATLVAANYFNSASGYLKVGDAICASTSDPAWHIYNVTANAAGVVTVATAL